MRTGKNDIKDGHLQTGWNCNSLTVVGAMQFIFSMHHIIRFIVLAVMANYDELLIYYSIAPFGVIRYNIDCFLAKPPSRSIGFAFSAD